MIKKEVMVPKTIYEASDGQQFDDEREAKRYEDYLYFKNVVEENRFCKEDYETGYVIVETLEEAQKIAETVRSRVGGFYAHYLDKEKFPLMARIHSEDFKPTSVVGKEGYRMFKKRREIYDKLCKMYESLEGKEKDNERN